MLISNITIVFQNYRRKYPNKAFLVSFFVVAVIVVFFLLDFSYLDKFERVDFKYDLTFSNFGLQILKKGLFGSNLRILFLHKTLHFHKSEGADLKYGTNFLNLQPKITQVKHFLFQVWKLFCIKYCLMTYSKVLTSNMTIVRQNLSLQITQKHFCPKLNVFCMKICFDKFEGAGNSLLVFQNPSLKLYSQIRDLLSRF